MTINQMIKINKKHGYNFFDKKTMEFWNSKIETEVFENNTFVTSENNYDRTKILYTARLFNPISGRIKTIGEFQQFETLEEAIEFAKNYKN